MKASARSGLVWGALAVSVVAIGACQSIVGINDYVEATGAGASSAGGANGGGGASTTSTAGTGGVGGVGGVGGSCAGVAGDVCSTANDCHSTCSNEVLSCVSGFCVDQFNCALEFPAEVTILDVALVGNAAYVLLLRGAPTSEMVLRKADLSSTACTFEPEGSTLEFSSALEPSEIEARLSVLGDRIYVGWQANASLSGDSGDTATCRTAWWDGSDLMAMPTVLPEAPSCISAVPAYEPTLFGFKVVANLTNTGHLAFFGAKQSTSADWVIHRVDVEGSTSTRWRMDNAAFRAFEIDATEVSAVAKSAAACIATGESAPLGAFGASTKTNLGLVGDPLCTFRMTFPGHTNPVWNSPPSAKVEADWLNAEGLEFARWGGVLTLIGHEPAMSDETLIRVRQLPVAQEFLNVRVAVDPLDFTPVFAASGDTLVMAGAATAEIREVVPDQVLVNQVANTLPFIIGFQTQFAGRRRYSLAWRTTNSLASASVRGVRLHEAGNTNHLALFGSSTEDVFYGGPAALMRGAFVVFYSVTPP